MQRLGHQLLAGARLAGDEDRRVRAGDLADELEDLEHRPGGSDDALALGGALAQLEPQRAHLRAEVGVVEDAAQGGQQVVDLERLGDVVVRAVLHGLDGGGAAAEGGHDDDLELVVLALQLLEDRQAVPIGQLDVHHHQVRPLLVVGDLGDRIGPGLGDAGGVAGVLQEVGQEGDDLGVVVDDENPAGVGA